MFYIVLALVLAVVGTESKNFEITDVPWKNEVSACWSGGYHQLSYITYVGRLTDYNATYGDITDATTVVKANGDLNLKTGREGTLSRNEMSLTEFYQDASSKAFTGAWSITSKNWLATQTVTIKLMVTFYDDNKVNFYSYVYAGSWWATSCAEANYVGCNRRIQRKCKI